MSGTCVRCMKCNNVFRVIHGVSTENLHKRCNLNSFEKEKFKGNDFFCCGKQHLRNLFSLGDHEEMNQLIGGWLKILSRVQNESKTKKSIS